MSYFHDLKYIGIVVCLWCYGIMNKSMAQSSVLSGDPIRIVLIGDSSVSNFDPSLRELRGWGQMLPDYFKQPEVQINNLARSGRSSKSYLKEGLWENVLHLLPAPNYVLIHFGSNDAKGKGPDRETLPDEVPAQLLAEGIGSDPADWYRNNLRTYIEQTRQMGAVPVIVTPAERRYFAKGVIRRTNQLYAEAAIVVAKEMNVQLIDLSDYTVSVYNRLGQEGSNFMHPLSADGKGYDLHFSEAGARIWAEFIAEQLGQNISQLKPFVKLPSQRTVDQVQATSN